MRCSDCAGEGGEYGGDTQDQNTREIATTYLRRNGWPIASIELPLKLAQLSGSSLSLLLDAEADTPAQVQTVWAHARHHTPPHHEHTLPCHPRGLVRAL